MDIKIKCISRATQALYISVQTNKEYNKLYYNKCIDDGRWSRKYEIDVVDVGLRLTRESVLGDV
jgi:hypothetical protein